MKELWKRLCDWCWFYIYLSGNEFDHKLNLNYVRIFAGKTTLKEDTVRIIKQRQRAHDLDMKYRDMRT
jgi:hypothetical protein